MFYQEMLEMTGYKPKTTFWDDFSIADCFGAKAINDTFKRAFKEWKSNYIYLTELVMILNWKMWQWQSNEAMCALYHELWGKADDYACTNLNGEELSYFYQVTD